MLSCAASRRGLKVNAMAVVRSFLFAPGNHARRMEKALTLDADAVILDLEDACPISEKAATRPLVVAALQKPRTGLGYIRVNPISTDFGYQDILSVVRPGVDGIVVPKIERADEAQDHRLARVPDRARAGHAGGRARHHADHRDRARRR